MIPIPLAYKMKDPEKYTLNFDSTSLERDDLLAHTPYVYESIIVFTRISMLTEN